MYDVDTAATDARSASADSNYRVACIDTLAGLASLQPAWEALEGRDPDAGFFLSWAFLSRILADNPGRWRVFAVHHVASGQVHCLLPVRYRRSSKGAAFNRMRAAGRMAWAEYTGFICDPDHRTALAQDLSERQWSRLSLQYASSPAAAKIFAAAFDPAQFDARLNSYFINDRQTDSLVCPQVPLPGDFDSYLTGLSRNKRQKMRKALRNHVESGQLRLSVATAETLGRDMEVMFDLWRARWGAEKSPERLDDTIDTHRHLFETCRSLRAFHLTTLWLGDRPVGALGLIGAKSGRKLLVKMTGRDPDQADLPVGMMLHLLTIRWAISEGFTTYDFGHGDEPYKFGFGAQVRRVAYLTVQRR